MSRVGRRGLVECMSWGYLVIGVGFYIAYRDWSVVTFVYQVAGILSSWIMRYGCSVFNYSDGSECIFGIHDWFIHACSRYWLGILVNSLGCSVVQTG